MEIGMFGLMHNVMNAHIVKIYNSAFLYTENYTEESKKFHNSTTVNILTYVFLIFSTKT